MPGSCLRHAVETPALHLAAPNSNPPLLLFIPPFAHPDTLNPKFRRRRFRFAAVSARSCFRFCHSALLCPFHQLRIWLEAEEVRFQSFALRLLLVFLSLSPLSPAQPVPFISLGVTGLTLILLSNQASCPPFPWNHRLILLRELSALPFSASLPRIMTLEDISSDLV